MHSGSPFRDGHPEVLRELFGGLTPKASLVLAQGISQEEAKAFFLSRGVAISSHAVLKLSDLARQVLGVPSARKISDTAQKELLRKIFREQRLGKFFPELTRLKRKRDFYAKCLKAIQNGRKAYAHESELEVLESRLEQAQVTNPLRAELKGVALIFEAWLEDHDVYDDIRLLTQAAARLNDPTVAHEFKIPSQIFAIEDPRRESLELAFVEALARKTEWVKVPFEEFLGLPSSSADAEETPPGPKISWERAHLVDDATDGLADALSASPNALILIPEVAEVRLSLKRALRERTIHERDERDPLEPLLSETVKQSRLPLQVLRSNFSRRIVMEWLRSALRPATLDVATVELAIQEMNSLGLHKGLEGYRQIRRPQVYEALRDLRASFSGRFTLERFQRAHFAALPPVIQNRLVPLYQLWQADQQMLREEARVAPFLFWMEKLEERYPDLKPQVAPLRDADGVEIYRLTQNTIRPPVDRIYILGIPANWTSGGKVGDWFFNERDREILGLEFQVFDATKEQRERQTQLRRWLSLARREVVFLDYEYNAQAAEREDLSVLLRSLGVPDPDAIRVLTGSHPRRRGAYSKWDQPVQPQQVEFAQTRVRAETQDDEPIFVLKASEVERYSRCPFVTMAHYRWQLEDLREPETDLWGDTRGNLVHRALEILLQSVDPGGQFIETAQSCVDRAWQEVPLRGLVQSSKIIAYAKKRLVRSIEKFMIEEAAYRARALAQTFELESKYELLLPVGQVRVKIRMRIDRVDTKPDSAGLFVIDYKTSGGNPTGQRMLKLGYRLQLPIYALAVQRKWNRPVDGAQFIEVTQKPSRTHGVFSKNLNGDSPGQWTDFHSRNGSLFKEELSEIWSQFETQLESQVQSYLAGRFDPHPRDPKECMTCPYPDLCGKTRLKSIAVSEAGEDLA